MTEKDTLKIPDKDLSREGWLDIVKPVYEAGRLDHIPARKPVTLHDHKVAQSQNYWLTRKSIGFPDTDWHERIFGNGRKS